ncbi:MAG TPA: hypothetical protein VLJ15_07505 [Gammaproteobacteria bacterium]|nr:hypothetical protein [Gammaproteobacteria bacterium]
MLSHPIKKGSKEHKEQDATRENERRLAKFRASIKPVLNEMKESGKSLEYFEARKLIIQFSTLAPWRDQKSVHKAYLAELEKTDPSEKSLKAFVENLRWEIAAANEVENNRANNPPELIEPYSDVELELPGVADQQPGLPDFSSPAAFDQRLKDIIAAEGGGEWRQPDSPGSPPVDSSLSPMALVSQSIFRLTPPTPTESTGQNAKAEQDAEATTVFHSRPRGLSNGSD